MKVIKYENYIVENLLTGEIYDEFKVLNERFITYADLGMSAPSYKRNVISYLIDLMGVSEKDFKGRDEAREKLKIIFNQNPEIDETIRRYKDRKCRYQFCAEHIYEWFIKRNDI